MNYEPHGLENRQTGIYMPGGQWLDVSIQYDHKDDVRDMFY